MDVAFDNVLDNAFVEFVVVGKLVPEVYGMPSWWGLRVGIRGWGGRGRRRGLAVGYAIFLVETVIEEGMEDFVEHKIRVRIIDECLFEGIDMLGENLVGGGGFISAVDHGTDGGFFIPMRTFAIEVKIDTGVCRFNVRLGYDIFAAIVNVYVQKVYFVIDSDLSGEF